MSLFEYLTLDLFNGNSNLILIAADLIFIVVVIYLFQYICKQAENKYVEAALSAASIAIGFIMLDSQYHAVLLRSRFMFFFICAAVTMSSIYIIKLIELKMIDYALLFMAILILEIVVRRLSIVIYYERMSVRGIYLFCILLLISRKRSKRNSLLNIWMTYAISLIFHLLYIIFCDFYLWHWYYNLSTTYSFGLIGKSLIFLVSGVLLIVVCVIVSYVLRHTLSGFFKDLEELDSNYQGIGKSFMKVSVTIFVFIYVIEYIPYLLMSYKGTLENILKMALFLVITFLVVVQIVYLKMILQLGKIKGRAEQLAQDTRNLLLYNSDLEKNMQEIRNIKHDIKNIFFTMGEFINRSDDRELKDFYTQKIVPFADFEIKKSDVYTKLQQIPHEEFRAFLYYKINQGMSYGVNFRLEISAGTMLLNNQQTFTDIVRMIGILIDNSIEETIEIGGALVTIKISSDETQENYIIENPVRQNIRAKGIVSGTTTKGLGRGKGLAIIDDILDKYDNIVKNTYFKEDIFVQNIVIYKEDKF